MQLSKRQLVMHPDCNTTENLFGGRLLAWMDEAAGLYAICQANSQRIVTAHFGALDFKRLTPLGSVVEIYCDTISKGRTSIRVKIEAYIKKPHGVKELIAENEAVFVAVDEDNNPTPLKD